jgi:aspartate carbamoyltransferase catalytic subunit
MKSLISIDDLKDDDIGRLFYRARSITHVMPKKFEDAVMMTAFFEPSTRTRLSFEMAALRMSIKVTSFFAPSSSLQKGETVDETIKNLLALSPDILVIRHNEKLNLGPCEHAIINAGDGTNEHPTQALLDCFTLLNHFQTDDLRHKRILIIGDLAHSRVAHSNIKLMKRMGAQITLLAPDEWRMPETDLRSISSFKQCDGDYDAVMCLRIQKERLPEADSFIENAYFFHYGLNSERLSKLGKNCVVLHPGPMNLGLEIDAEVASCERSLIEQQVKNGVLIRAALIEHCLLRGP